MNIGITVLYCTLKGEILPAIITYVHNNECVDLRVIPNSGECMSHETSVLRGEESGRWTPIEGESNTACYDPIGYDLELSCDKDAGDIPEDEEPPVGSEDDRNSELPEEPTKEPSNLSS